MCTDSCPFTDIRDWLMIGSNSKTIRGNSWNISCGIYGNIYINMSFVYIEILLHECTIYSYTYYIYIYCNSAWWSKNPGLTSHLWLLDPLVDILRFNKPIMTWWKSPWVSTEFQFRFCFPECHIGKNWKRRCVDVIRRVQFVNGRMRLSRIWRQLLSRRPRWRCLWLL